MPRTALGIRRTTVHLNESSFTDIEAIVAEHDVKQNEIIRAAVKIALLPTFRKLLLAEVIRPESEEVTRPWTPQRVTAMARRLGSPEAQTTKLPDGRFIVVGVTQDTAKELRRAGLSAQFGNGALMVKAKEAS